jgi:hypothetical protein
MRAEQARLVVYEVNYVFSPDSRGDLPDSRDGAVYPDEIGAHLVLGSQLQIHQLRKLGYNWIDF